MIVFKTTKPLIPLIQKSKCLSITARLRLLFTADPESTTNDRRMLKYYYREFHHIETFEEYENNPNAPTVESLRRARQKMAEKMEASMIADLQQAGILK